MSGEAILFMLLTMGGVFALNVLCIVLWLRAPKAPSAAAPAEAPEPPVSAPPAAGPAEPSPP